MLVSPMETVSEDHKVEIKEKEKIEKYVDLIKKSYRKLNQLKYSEESWKTDGLLWFYGISTIVGYLRSDPVFTYTSNI